ncbi:FAD-binding dehydrogenase [Thalassotalea sp. PLHSN55]|uniref:FAD-binding dehydrogenase n=1 Tax=Thalassotalea sp. PLHSN55 TaxID=3435888 RepID=UPI003F851E00
MSSNIECKNLVIGGGIAGIVTALELLNQNQPVVLVDRDSEVKFGGQANDAFGGMLLVDTPIQKKVGINDSFELAKADWFAAAQFKDTDIWGKRWAETYIEQCKTDVYDWLLSYGVKFLPLVHWVERGDYGHGSPGRGNSVPRYHVVWGCGRGLMHTLIDALKNHKNNDKLTLLFDHLIDEFTLDGNQLSGCTGQHNSQSFAIKADNIVVASGGINGNLEKVREVWDSCYGEYPENILTGCHPNADGLLHDKSKVADASVINLNQMWNYAAGIAHPEPKYDRHGLSMIPARSSLWMDCYGNRVGPKPMMTGFDTHDLCKTTGHLPKQYTWQVMNWKIAIKELAVSGTDENPNFRDKKLHKIVWELLTGNKRLANYLIDECEDVVTGNTLEELVSNMNKLTGDESVSFENMHRDITAYDNTIKRGDNLRNDDQIRKIAQLRTWRGDKIRTCKFQPILDDKELPLIAIRSRLISRKSMGGFETNLQSQVLNSQGQAINNLYAVGEAAGFGGGGVSGIRSLEGTFLSNSILNARFAAKAIANNE